MPDSACPACGSQRLVEGALYSPMRSSFRPQATKFLTLDTGDVMLKAVMCAQCGHVALIGNVAKLRRLTQEEDRAGG